MTKADILGYIASIIGTLVMAPQVVRLIRTKKAANLSLGTVLLYLANCLLWFIYGCLIKAPPVILANAIGFVIGTLQLIFKLKYHNN